MRPKDWLSPVLLWEMTTIVRRARHFWIRSLFACFVFSLLWSSFSEIYGSVRSSDTQSIAAMGPRFTTRFIYLFSFGELGAVVLLTPGYVATAVAVEKQRRTIEYLFATDLTNREIVFGKWFARMMNVQMLVLASLPIPAFATFFGGVEPERVMLLITLSLVSAASMSAIAILVSVFAKDVQTALRNAYAVVIALLIGPFFVVWVASEVAQSLNYSVTDTSIQVATDTQVLAQLLEQMLHASHPFLVFADVIEGTFEARFRQVLIFVGIQALLGVFCLTVACVRIRKSYIAQEAKEHASKKPFWSRARDRGTRSVGDMPMSWKEWYFGARRKRSILITIIGVVLVLSLYVPILLSMAKVGVSPDSGLSSVHQTNVESARWALIGSGLMMVFFTYTVIASRAAASVGSERDKDSWITLLSTTLTAREILEGKFHGSLKPLVTLLIVMTPAWILGVSIGAIGIMQILFHLGAILAYAFWIAGLGVYESVRRQTTGKALGTTFGWISFFGGFGHLLSVLLALPLMSTGLFTSELIGKLYVMSLPWTILVGSLFFNHDIIATENDVIGIAIFYLLVFGLAGYSLLYKGIAEFEKWTGRIEDRTSFFGAQRQAEISAGAEVPTPVIVDES